jgi:hypothetical protein
MNITPSDEFLTGPAAIIGVLQSCDRQLVDRIRQAHIEIVEAARIENSRESLHDQNL